PDARPAPGRARRRVRARGSPPRNGARRGRAGQHPLLRRRGDGHGGEPRGRTGRPLPEPSRGRAMTRPRFSSEGGAVLVSGLLLSVALLMVIGCAVDI